MAEFPFVIVVNPTVPATTLAEFVAWAKAQSDPILYGSPSAGSQQHLGMEQLASRLGIRVTNVPYRGGAPATMDLLAGQIRVGSIGLPPLVPHLRAGTLRALAVSTGQRSPLAPDVPTIAEAAVPGLEMAVWYGLVAPRDTPGPILRYIEAALQRALARPETVAKLGEQGLSARFMDAAAFDSFLKREIDSWGAAARASGVRLN
jgi:tripartite-type tricarboxylate transporter receptor subunit TctC